MVPGPELDSQVARTVFGYAVVIDTQAGQQYIVHRDGAQTPVPEYSSDVEIAYQVTDQLHKMGFTLSVKNEVQNGKNIWQTAFVKQDKRSYLANVAEDLASAICVAGILAVTGQNIAK